MSHCLAFTVPASAIAWLQGQPTSARRHTPCCSLIQAELAAPPPALSTGCLDLFLAESTFSAERDWTLTQLCTSGHGARDSEVQEEPTPGIQCGRQQPWEPGLWNTWLEREKQRDPGFSAGDRGAYFISKASRDAGRAGSLLCHIRSKGKKQWRLAGAVVCAQRDLGKCPQCQGYMHCHVGCWEG